MVILNPKQRQAAEFLEGVCAVIAIPGSGKTLTMTERIAWLIRQHQVAPESILGLTFPRNAAENMRQKLELILEDLASQVMLSTIHSFCYWLLRNEGQPGEILAGKQQLLVIKKLMQRLGTREISLGTVVRDISLAKNNLVTVGEFQLLAQGDSLMAQLAEVYEEYEREKARRRLMDLDDLLVNVHGLLQERQKYWTGTGSCFPTCWWTSFRTPTRPSWKF
jgi:DNA helicase-2/ATP-dependent DNA helicase PcrA